MSSASHAQAKQRAALISVLASAALTVGKLVVGPLTGSIAILGEAVHSLLDLGAVLVTYFAVRVSDKPPDRDHPYGHGKIESVAALSETVLLLLTSIGILWEAGQRLLSGHEPVKVTWWSAAVIAAAIVIDFGRWRMLRRLAKETRSPALEADALHFSSDIMTSAVVLVGLGLVAAGYRNGDSLAAVGVAGFVGLAAVRLGRQTIDTLIDTAPEGIAERVRSIATRTPGVVEVGRVRARPAGATLQVDLEVGVNRRTPLDRVGEVSRLVDDHVREALPGAEVAVSTFPVTLNDESMRERILMIAAYHGHPIHHVTVQHLDERLAISLDVEIDGRQTLAEAHETATRLETAIAEDLGGDVDVQTHIEPLMREEVEGTAASADLTKQVAAAIALIARDMPGVIDTHDVRVRQDASGLFISFHCTFAPDHRVDFVHETASRIEARLRQRFNAYRILTHAEPPDKAA